MELPAKGGALERSSLRREKRAAPPHVHTVHIDDASPDHHAHDDVRGLGRPDLIYRIHWSMPNGSKFWHEHNWWVRHVPTLPFGTQLVQCVTGAPFTHEREATWMTPVAADAHSIRIG